jgi:hypothetical protein
VTFDASRYKVSAIDPTGANEIVVREHYLHRRPSNSYSFGLWSEDEVGPVGVLIFGFPASRHLQLGASPDAPETVIELNRLWVADSEPRNSESFFVARCLQAIPPFIVVSYADTKHEHVGTVYRALNFNYAGWTDMERKTARYDYVSDRGLHSRESFRGEGTPGWSRRVQRKPKARYWTTTGDRRERRALAVMCKWPILDWREYPVPSEHRQCLKPRTRSYSGCGPSGDH